MTNPEKTLLVLPSSAGANVVTISDAAECVMDFLKDLGTFFRRGGAIFRLDEGRLQPLTAPLLQSLLFTQMTIKVWRNANGRGKLAGATEIKDSTLKGIMGSHLVSTLPNISVVLDTPQLMKDQEDLVLLKPGYNVERGGIYVLGDTVPEEVPVSNAVESLQGLFKDFRFATPSDHSRAVAAMLVPCFRIGGIYERHPLLAFEADQSQTGKTLLWSCIATLYGQNYATVTQKRGGVGSLDESLMEKLVDGRSFVLLDNMRGPLDSPFMEACLTLENGGVSARIAGVKSIPVDPRPVVFGMTSNQVVLTKDMSNRVLMTELRKQPMDYGFYSWKDRDGKDIDLRGHIFSRQAHYLGCVVAIVKDWWKNGAQRKTCKAHDFRECIGALDFIVQTYFSLPPLMDGHQGAMERTTKPGLSFLRTIAISAATDWYVIDWTAKHLAEQCIADGIQIPGVDPDADAVEVSKKLGGLLGEVFGKKDSLEIDGITIKRSEIIDAEGRARKAYTFKK